MSLEVSSLRAIAHPVRLRILSLLSGASMCAADVARELGISQANASYHVRVLAAAGYLVESGSANVRGGVAKLYTHPWQDQRRSRPGRRSSAETTALVEAMSEELRRRSCVRDEEGRATFTDAELWVDPATWEHVVAAVHEASVRLHAAAQPPRATAAIRVNMTAALFAMATPDESQGGHAQA
jgi:DNA-binding transcriptional ArsR family regulator